MGDELENALFAPLGDTGQDTTVQGGRPPSPSALNDDELTDADAPGSPDDTLSPATAAQMPEQHGTPMLFTLAGNKKKLTEKEPSVVRGLLAALNAKEVKCFTDAFAGTGYFTLWAAVQQRTGAVKSGLQQIMNEWDSYRHNTLKTVQQYPEQVKRELTLHLDQIKSLFYRVLNDIPVYKSIDGERLRETDEELADHIARQLGRDPGVLRRSEKMQLMDDTVNACIAAAQIDQATNRELSVALRSYILGSIDHPLPPEADIPTSEDITLRARNAALYLLAQHNNYIGSLPVKFDSVRERRNTDPSGLSSRPAVITNRLLTNYHKVNDNTAQGKLLLGRAATELRTKYTQLKLPDEIDKVSDVLTGVEIRQGDGWALLASLRRGAFAAIDPPYWEPPTSGRGVRYVKASLSLDEYTLDGFLDKVDKHVMPGWMKEDVRLMVFNRSSDDYVSRMMNRGFEVYKMQSGRANNKNKKNQGNVEEVMAVNFHFDSNATLHRYVTHPDPERLRSAPGQASAEVEAYEAPAGFKKPVF